MVFRVVFREDICCRYLCFQRKVCRGRCYSETADMTSWALPVLLCHCVHSVPVWQ